MSTPSHRPPPLPTRRGRNLALLIVVIVVVVFITLCGGMYYGFRCLMTAFESGDYSYDVYQCERNIEEIALIKEEWVTAHNGKPGDRIPPTDLAQSLAEHGENLICPLDPKHSAQTSYEFGAIGTDPTCKCKALHDQKRSEKKQK